MKTIKLKHKLLAVGIAAALGFCMGGTALAGVKSYSTNDITTHIAVRDAQGNRITLDDLNFQPTASSDASATKTIQPDEMNPIDLADVDGPQIGAEACVGILPANPDCKATKPDTFAQQPIVADSDFCRGKGDILSFGPTDDPDSTVEDGGVSVATAECQFDRQNTGQGDSGNSFSASFQVSEAQAGTEISFELLSKPFMEVFCHDNPLFTPNATSSMTVSITITTNDGTPVFSFSPNGVLDAGEAKDEADLNIDRFCNARGEVIIYDPITLPQGTNDCNDAANPGNDFPDRCEYESTTVPLAPGDYRMVVAQSQNTEGAKIEVPVNGDGDHFLCYKSFGHFLREKVDLLDQFDLFDESGPKNYDVFKPKMFCNPAIKPERDPEAELEFDPHYLSYKINEGRRVPRHVSKRVQLFNQFHPNGIVVDTHKPDRLMVPSGKSLDLGQVPAIPAAGPNTNHYKCYTIRGGEFDSPGDVAILDQFTDEDGKKLNIVKPVRLCNPVVKTRSDGSVTPIIPDPDADPDNPLDHLTCYRVKRGEGERYNGRTKVLSNNQFGSEELVLKRELEFCVPTTKRLLTETPL